MTLDILRGSSTLVATIPVYDSFIFSRSLMQEHQITINGLVVTEPLPIQVNDYIIHKGIKYTINTVPDVVGTVRFAYSIKFEGPEYTMYKKIMFHQGVADFPYFGTPEEHIDLILANINTLDPGWTKGTIDDGEPQFVDYSNVTCRAALGLVAEKFVLEYSFDNKQVNMVKQVGNATALVFRYGRGAGLYSLTRKAVNEDGIKTKIYGFGSPRNLPEGYRGMGSNGTIPRLSFDGGGFIERNSDIYGVSEGFYNNEEIYPSRESLVSAVGAITDDSKTFTIQDNTLDFNINDHKLPAVEGKIQFITGDLTGEEFTIVSYNNSTKTLTLNTKVNSSSVKLPSTVFLPVIGDRFVLLDISLPQEYIDAAELKLKNATISYTDTKSVPRVEYDLSLDILFMKLNGYEINPGDLVTIKNLSLGIDDEIRVQSVNYPLTFPDVLTKNSKYNVGIANFITYTVQERETMEIRENKNTIKFVDRRSIELARRNTANFRDLQELVFDSEGYFDPERIKPFSIETYMLSVGAAAQDFRLNGVVITPNLDNDPNAFSVSNGLLEHFILEIPGLGYSWTIPTKTITGLNPTKPYYFYAKCSQTVLTGEWMLSETPVLAEDTVGYWNFNIGILYRVKDGYRDDDFTFGKTTIVGNNIKTGRVQDITEQNYFDLSTGQFNLGPLPGKGIDFDVTTPDTLTIRGALMQNSGGITAPLPLYRGPFIPGTTYYPNDTVTNGGTTWLYIYPTSTAVTDAPTEGTYWTVYAQKGADGGAGSAVEIEYSVDGSTLWHSTFTTGDLFMRQRIGSGAWSAAIRIVGEDGEPGADGQYTSYEFAKNTSLTTAPTTGFTDAPPSLAAGEYLWTRIGTFNADGQIGDWSTPVRLSGPPGDDGATLYTWVKYADDAAGSGLSDNPTGKTYIGLAYNKTVPSESINPADYTWALFSGEGVQGPPGDDGTTYYTWIKYADTPTTGMSDSPTGKAYLGLAYNKTSPTESTDYADYLWSKILGDTGATGPTGPTGNYTELRFNKNSSTTVPPDLTVTNPNPISEGWTTSQPTLGVAEYGWITSALKTAAGVLVTDWSTPTRFSGLKGESGNPGSDGADGPYLNYRGDYDNTASYAGSSTNIQAVKYSGSYYVTRRDAGAIPVGTLPTDTDYFNLYGGQFESIATGLLLAELAYIENLGVRNLKTADSGRRLEITADNNRLSFFGVNSSDSSIYEAVRIADDVDSSQATGQSLGGIELNNPNGRRTFATGNGVFSNGSGTQFLPGSSGIINNASLVGLLFDRNSDTSGISAAVVGRDATTTGNSTSYAGYFVGKVKIEGALDVSSISKINGSTPHSGIVAYRNGLNQTKGMNVDNGLIIATELNI